MLRAVIFDFDGVITDSEILHFYAYNQVLAKYKILITKKDYYTDYLGLSDFDFFKAFSDKGLLILDGENTRQLLRQKTKIFEKLAKSQGSIIDGVPEFLTMLKQNNIPMAICSGAVLSEIELILEQAHLRSFFEDIVSAEQVTRGKPDPQGFSLTLKKLNEKKRDLIHSNQCVVIEDSHWGLEAANAAGMHSIAITNSYTAEQLAMAEKTVSHLSELNITDLHKLCC
ncbi:MAG: HAD family phosphatase [Planctomycetota bacterium]|nr:HAD family phosphatase [Planctomycetota bacterium]